MKACEERAVTSQVSYLSYLVLPLIDIKKVSQVTDVPMTVLPVLPCPTYVIIYMGEGRVWVNGNRCTGRTGRARPCKPQLSRVSA